MYKSDFSRASARRKLFAGRLLTQFFFRDLRPARRYITLRVSCFADAWGVRTLVLKRKKLALFSGVKVPVEESQQNSWKPTKIFAHMTSKIYGDLSAGHFLFSGATAVQRSPKHSCSSVPLLLRRRRKRCAVRRRRRNRCAVRPMTAVVFTRTAR